VKPDDVAATVTTLVDQPGSAWTFELEAHPFGETLIAPQAARRSATP
jgi:hypothetical protein